MILPWYYLVSYQTQFYVFGVWWPDSQHTGAPPSFNLRTDVISQVKTPAQPCTCDTPPVQMTFTGKIAPYSGELWYNKMRFWSWRPVNLTSSMKLSVCWSFPIHFIIQKFIFTISMMNTPGFYMNLAPCAAVTLFATHTVQTHGHTHSLYCVCIDSDPVTHLLSLSRLVNILLISPFLHPFLTSWHIHNSDYFCDGWK